MRALRVKRSKGMADCMLTTIGKSLNTVRDLEVEGTSFNPDKGCVVGLTSLDKQLEVRFLYQWKWPPGLGLTKTSS